MTYLKRGKCSQTEIAMHTHDLISYKNCRQQWKWSSPFGMHLEPKPSVTIQADGTKVTNVNKNLWYGSAMHFALEDYEGTKRFESLREAFDAYVGAFPIEERPSEWPELVEMGHNLFDFLQPWLDHNKDWKVVHLDGVPLVEQKFSLVLAPLCYYEITSGHRYFATETEGVFVCKTLLNRLTKEELELEGAKYVEIVAHGTFDAIVEDEYGNWYVLDYKSAASFDTDKLSLDQQISFYSWAASQYFQRPVDGFVYVQITKNPPKPPKLTKTGVSTDKRQRTTAELYLQTCVEYYGDVSDIPSKNMEFYHSLTDRTDDFINVQWVERNQHHQEEFYKQIIQQGLEILNPQTAIYANPTTDCKWRCPFRTVCIAKHEGADWEYLLNEMFQPRVETLTDDYKTWEKRLFLQHPDKYPKEVASLQTETAPMTEEEELEAFLADN